MRPEDWQDVQVIYQQGIESRQATFETAVPTWDEWNRSKLPNCRLTALNDNLIIGWAALSPISRRQVYAGVAEVSIYVRQKARRQGVGHTLLKALVKCSEGAGIWTLQSSVFPENQATLTLHHKLGFRIIGKRERIALHHGVWRDTILLERRSQFVGI